MLMQSHLMVDTKGLKQIELCSQDTLRKRSGQDRKPTPLAEGARIAYHSRTKPVPASLYMNNTQAWAHRPDLDDACQEVLMKRNLRPWQWRCYIVNNKLDKFSLAFI